VFLVGHGQVDEPVHGQLAERYDHVALDGPWWLLLPGVGEFALPDGPRPWTEMGSDAERFSGVGRYVTEVDLDEAIVGERRVFLTAEVGDIGRVVVNGADCGVLWTAPFEVEVTHALRPGRNVVEVHVANAWMNRLIAEAGSPTGQIFAPVSQVYAAEATPRLSGVLGSARLHLGRFLPTGS
jgi:hypothetical protein